MISKNDNILKITLAILLTLFGIMGVISCDEIIPTETVSTPTPTPHVHTIVEDNAVKATCIENGLTKGSRCSDCGEIIEKQRTIEATGHKEVIDKAIKPTCTKGGKTEGKHCSVCNETIVKQEEIEETGHKEVIDKAIEPSCTLDGKTEGKHCSVCNEIIVDSNILKAYNHKDNVVTTVESTCTKEGESVFVCRICDYTKKDTLPAKGHDWSDATCESPKICKVCKMTQGEVLGHTTKSGVCSRCNQEIIDYKQLEIDEENKRHNNKLVEIETLYDFMIEERENEVEELMRSNGIYTLYSTAYYDSRISELKSKINSLRNNLAYYEQSPSQFQYQIMQTKSELADCENEIYKALVGKAIADQYEQIPDLSQLKREKINYENALHRENLEKINSKYDY